MKTSAITCGSIRKTHILYNISVGENTIKYACYLTYPMQLCGARQLNDGNIRRVALLIVC